MQQELPKETPGQEHARLDKTAWQLGVAQTRANVLGLQLLKTKTELKGLQDMLAKAKETLNSGRLTSQESQAGKLEPATPPFKPGMARPPLEDHRKPGV